MARGSDVQPLACGCLDIAGLDGCSGHHGGELPLSVGAARQEAGAVVGENGAVSRPTNLTVDGAMTIWLIRAGSRQDRKLELLLKRYACSKT
jgi:hypothetical protein